MGGEGKSERPHAYGSVCLVLLFMKRRAAEVASRLVRADKAVAVVRRQVAVVCAPFNWNRTKVGADGQARQLPRFAPMGRAQPVAR
ncbi:hypothetical protein R1flu_029052 [Riccia fluitans]|uniref:Uncharacterized protein n=1 Tax=Riccia fluitans TaxID=41844 RepID=A0ABD1XNE9_9MARC